MDFTLTQQQELLKKAARDFLSSECPPKLVRKMEADQKGYPFDLWHKMADLGWQGLIFPREYGGAGGNFLDLVVLVEEMGRVCLPAPFFSTVILGGICIKEAASEAQKKELLPRIVKGDLILTLALTEIEADYEPDSIITSAHASKKSFIINGIKLFVADAGNADQMICVARTRERSTNTKSFSLFLIDSHSKGIEYKLLSTIDGSKQYEVIFDNVKIPTNNMLGKLNNGWQYIEKVLIMAKVAKCAESVGGLGRILEMSLQYAKNRVQFGHPIGINQAIQLHCANMAIDYEISRFLTYKAAWSISEGLPCTKEVATAKAWVSDAYTRATYLGQLVHGGIGFCLEHDISLYIRRAKTSEVIFGDATLHREIVANKLGL